MLSRLGPNKRRTRLLYFLSVASASWRRSQMSMSYVLSGIAIVICAGIGAAIAWIIVSSIGWGGVGGAIVATVIGMVLATTLFAGGIVIGKAMGYFK
jgi:hypothetical protein